MEPFRVPFEALHPFRVSPIPLQSSPTPKTPQRDGLTHHWGGSVPPGIATPLTPRGEIFGGEGASVTPLQAFGPIGSPERGFYGAMGR